ncbi:MAG: hypothetical protein ACRDR6_30960 [Pseudonocardiaceae bacterium]
MNSMALKLATETDGEAAGPDGQPIDPALTERHPILTEEEADELRSQLRCGRTLPVMHLVEADDVFFLQRHWQEFTALCGVPMTERSWHQDDDGCPGCRDCLRYCAACVRSAAEGVEQTEQTAESTSVSSAG